jgi:hypothetical protein
MSDMTDRIDFDHLGIGTVLKRDRLAVPLNQRDYAWIDKHVKELFQDFSSAISKRSYFLGTIVLTPGKGGIPLVTDGQQRLATTTILLAAIRDHLYHRKEDKQFNSIELEFLVRFDRDTDEDAPRLTLNMSDNEFFRKRILSRPDSPDRQVVPTQGSHRKIARAAELAAEHIQNILAAHSEKNRVGVLKDWVRFVEKTAQVILLKVPDDLNAFTMFETLNDRGLRTTQFDLVKNYLFGQVGERAEEAHWKWSNMIGVLESTGDDEIYLTYLRHLLISMHGHVRERDIMEKIQFTVVGKTAAISFLDTLSDSAGIYVAIQTVNHAMWNGYPQEIRSSIETLDTLRIVQVRSLMLAVARTFNPVETEKAFRLLLNCSVRLLIVGGGRSGSIEEAYAATAKEVNEGRIDSSKSLGVALASIAPTDAHFEAEFRNARVSQNYLARYYLRALERTAKNQETPELIPDSGPGINLEHILPQNPGGDWSTISPETAAAYYKRIGNLVLLPAKVNTALGNEGFQTKKAAYAQSGYQLTSMVASEMDWGVDQITKRQEVLARLAVQTWPLGKLKKST